MKKKYLLTLFLAFSLILVACGQTANVDDPNDTSPDVIEDGVDPKEPTDDPEPIEDQPSDEHPDEDTNPIEETTPEGKENADVETTDKLIGVYLVKADQNIVDGQIYVKYEDGQIQPARMVQEENHSYVESELDGISDLGLVSGFNQDSGIPERSVISFGKADLFEDIEVSGKNLDADLDLESINEPIDLYEIYSKDNGDIYIKQAYQLGTTNKDYTLVIKNPQEVEANTDEVVNYLTVTLDIDR